MIRPRSILNAIFTAIIVAALSSACMGENTATEFFDPSADGAQIGDVGDFDPNADGSVSACAETDENGACVESTDSDGPIAIDDSPIAFGLGEVGGIECQEISIPGGLTFAAEIDDVGDAAEFSFLTSSGTYSQDRSEGTGSVSICYLRTEVGQHTGQFKLVIDANATTPTYAYVITLSGETLESFFTITAPVEGQIIDELDGRNEGKNDDEGDWLLTASGSVNLDLVSILDEGINTPIIITSANVKYKATISENGSFSTTIAVPQTPGIYDVSFSIDTNEDSQIIKTLSVVVATHPELEISIKDTSGVDISSGTPSDAQELVVGFKIKNLELSGSDQSMMPVAIESIAWDGVTIGKDLAAMWYDTDASWCGKDGEAPSTAGDDYTGFDATTTYCLPLSAFAEDISGQHQVTATARNELGTASATFTLILDFNKPVITISSPAENELLNTDTTTLTISGTVENYAPIDSSATAPEAKSADTGSYCRIADSVESDESCPESSVQLWINANTEKHAIYVYPQIDDAYAGLSNDDLFAKIESESPERCRNVDVENADGTTTSEKKCNLPKGSFSFQITVPDTSLNAKFNTYANLIEMRAQSLSGDRSHRTIAMRTFYTGETNGQKFSMTASGDGKVAIAMKGNLTAGSLGQIDDTTGLVVRAPLMINLTEGTAKDADLIRVLEHFLNKNVPFADVINGWISMPTDDDGNIDLEADFQRQYADDTDGKNYEDFWQDLDDDHQKEFIQQALHSNVMSQKLWALLRYEGYGVNHGWWPVDTAYMNFFDRDGDAEDDFNVALDSCDQVISTSFAPLKDFKYAYAHSDYDVNMIPRDFQEWPEVAGKNLDFDDFVSGRWIVQSVNFNEGTGNTGSIDIDACIVPSNADVDNCDDDIPYKDDLLPAIWGHFVSYNLVENGLLGQAALGLGIDDPTLPLVYSIGKLRLKLNDIIKIEKVKVDGQWTNKVTIDRDGITQYNVADSDVVTSETKPGDLSGGETLHDEDAMAKNSIQIYPYSRCRDYYQEQLDSGAYQDSGEGWNEIPFGCDQEDERWNYPFILETNSVQGHDLLNSPIFSQGQSYYLLGVVWQGVMDTFGKMIRCADEETINPMLNADLFPYPAWVPDSSKLATSFSVVDGDDGLSVTASEDVAEGQSELLSATLDAAGSDLNINHPDDPTSTSALTVRLPFSVTINDVMNPNLFLSSSLVSLNLAKTGDTAASDIETANVSGHLIRGDKDGVTATSYPLSCADNTDCKDPEKNVFTGISINIEELFNSAVYLLYKKGPLSLIDYFKSDDFDPDNLEINSNYSVGIDKVVLARFGICNSLAGALNTDLPPGILFSNIESQFDYPATHWDIELDKNYPPTLAIDPIAGLEDNNQAADIKIGLTNVRISVKELETTDTDNAFQIGNEVIQLRLDAVLSLKAIYHEDIASLYVFLDPYDDQNFHVSAVPGKGGAGYDDVDVVYNLVTEIVPNLMGKMSKTFSSELINADETAVTPTLSITFKTDGDGYMNVEDFSDVTVTTNMDEVSNGSCDGLDLPIYSSEVAGRTGIIESMAQNIPAAVNTPQAALTVLAEKQANRDKTVQQKSGSVLGLEKFTGAVTQITEINGLNLTGMCSENGYNTPLSNDSENPFAEALCDFGIKTLKIKPSLQFDTANGYIHVSSELLLDVYDWIKEGT